MVLSDAGFIVYNMCINTKKRKGFWSISGRSFRPPRPEFPVLLGFLQRGQRVGTRCIDPGATPKVPRSFRSEGRSFHPVSPEFPHRPEFPASLTGNSGLSGLQRLNFWEGYKYPSTYL